MGINFVKIKVANPARPKKAAVHDLRVDSGAVNSLLPARDLKKLGIKPVREEVFALRNLGVTAPEAIGLMVDPLSPRANPRAHASHGDADDHTRWSVKSQGDELMRKILGRYIVMDTEICHGELTFRGTRIFVNDILEQVAEGMAWESIIDSWRGSVKKAAIAEAVRLAGEALVKHREILAAATAD